MARKSSSGSTETTKPQVIDLGPEAIVDHGDAAPAEPPPNSDHAPVHDDVAESGPSPQRNARNSSSGIALPLAALVAGALAGGWLYREWLVSYLPPDQVTAMGARIAALEDGNAGGQEMLAGLGAENARINASLQQLSASVGKAETQSSTTQSVVDEMKNRLSSAETALAETERRLDDLKTAIAAAPATAAPAGHVDSAMLSTLNARLDMLEKDLVVLKSKVMATPDTDALSQALSDLKVKVAAGAPYTDELTRIARMVPAADGLDVLQTAAGTGLLTTAGLAAELHARVPDLPKSAGDTESGEQGYADWFLGLFGHLITVRKIGEADWQVIATNAATLAAGGHLPEAIAMIDEAGGDKPVALVEWRNRAEQRMMVDNALTRTSDAVMRQLAAKG